MASISLSSRILAINRDSQARTTFAISWHKAKRKAKSAKYLAKCAGLRVTSNEEMGAGAAKQIQWSVVATDGG